MIIWVDPGFPRVCRIGGNEGAAPVPSGRCDGRAMEQGYQAPLPQAD
jgi:hypothetical protein